MKKVVLALIVIAINTSVFADEKSNTLLTALQKKVASWGDYRVEFTVTIDDQTLKGTYEVSGASYHVVTPDIELYCDGSTRWEVSRTDREVAIDRIDPSDRTVMGNPTRLFDFLDGSYTHRYIGAALINGTSCERIELKDRSMTPDISTEASTTDTTVFPEVSQTIDVFLSTATGLPLRVGYTIGFMSTEATVDIVKITPNVTLDRAAFNYAPGRYTGYETIDFR